MKEGSNEQPKYVVARVVGFLKGKSAIQIARVFSGSAQEFLWGALLGTGILRVYRWQR